jgi:rod shape-determining protein MreC
MGGVASAWNRYVGFRRVESQNEKLQDEIFRLRQENMLLANDLAAVRDARDVAAGLAAIGRPFLVAAVVGVDAVNPYGSILIDRGTADGVRPNMPVVDRSGSLVGRVVMPVASRTATVLLVTDDASAVSVRSETSLVHGVLAGNSRDGTCRLRYVLATDEALADGEALLTSGFDGVFPAGLKAGTIASMAFDGSLFKRIVVRSHLDWRRMSRVAVLTAAAEAPPPEAR